MSTSPPRQFRNATPLPSNTMEQATTMATITLMDTTDVVSTTTQPELTTRTTTGTSMTAFSFAPLAISTTTARRSRSQRLLLARCMVYDVDDNDEAWDTLVTAVGSVYYDKRSLLDEPLNSPRFISMSVM